LGIKEKNKAFLLDAPVSVIDQFQEAKKQSAAFRQYLPLKKKQIPVGSCQQAPHSRKKRASLLGLPLKEAWGHRPWDHSQSLCKRIR